MKRRLSTEEIIDRLSKRVAALETGRDTHLDCINALMQVCIKHGLKEEALAAIRATGSDPTSSACES